MLRWGVPSLIIGLIFFADQSTKHAVLTIFKWQQTPLEITSFFQIVLVFNKGVSFGLLNNSSTLSFWLITTGICFLVLYLAFWLFTEKDPAQRLALSLIIGGALGNIYDRFARGAVVDFLDFFWHDYHWPAFNVADACIVIGVCLLLVLTLLKDKK